MVRRLFASIPTTILVRVPVTTLKKFGFKNVDVCFETNGKRSGVEIKVASGHFGAEPGAGANGHFDFPPSVEPPCPSFSAPRYPINKGALLGCCSSVSIS